MTDFDQVRYDLGARLFHWITVALVIVQFAVAWTMPDIGRGTQPLGLIAWHLSIGTVILFVTLARAGWRLTHRPPPTPASLSPLLGFASRATHVLLYALLMILPLLGWANASARGWSVTLFGVIPLPALCAQGSMLGREAGDIHQIVAWVLLAAIGAHVLGALYHLVIVRDRTVQRMI